MPSSTTKKKKKQSSTASNKNVFRPLIFCMRISIYFLPPGLTSIKHTCFEIAMKDLTNLPRPLLFRRDLLPFNSPVQETEKNDEIITFVTPTSIITHML